MTDIVKYVDLMDTKVDRSIFPTDNSFHKFNRSSNGTYYDLLVLPLSVLKNDYGFTYVYTENLYNNLELLFGSYWRASRLFLSFAGADSKDVEYLESIYYNGYDSASNKYLVISRFGDYVLLVNEDFNCLIQKVNKSAEYTKYNFGVQYEIIRGNITTLVDNYKKMYSSKYLSDFSESLYMFLENICSFDLRIFSYVKIKSLSLFQLMSEYLNISEAGCSLKSLAHGVLIRTVDEYVKLAIKRVNSSIVKNYDYAMKHKEELVAFEFLNLARLFRNKYWYKSSIVYYNNTNNACYVYLYTDGVQRMLTIHRVTDNFLLKCFNKRCQDDWEVFRHKYWITEGYECFISNIGDFEKVYTLEEILKESQYKFITKIESPRFVKDTHKDLLSIEICIYFKANKIEKDKLENFVKDNLVILDNVSLWKLCTNTNFIKMEIPTYDIKLDGKSIMADGGVRYQYHVDKVSKYKQDR